MKQFLSIEAEAWNKIMTWLNSLVGTSYGHWKVTKIVEWQVVPTGRPYEYNAVAQVETEVLQ